MSLHLLQSEREDKTHIKRRMAVFCVRGRQKPEDPKLSPMADDVITRGGTGDLGSLVYICGSNS